MSQNKLNRFLNFRKIPFKRINIFIFSSFLCLIPVNSQAIIIEGLVSSAAAIFTADKIGDTGILLMGQANALVKQFSSESTKLIREINQAADSVRARGFADARETFTHVKKGADGTLRLADTLVSKQLVAIDTIIENRINQIDEILRNNINILFQEVNLTVENIISEFEKGILSIFFGISGLIVLLLTSILVVLLMYYYTKNEQLPLKKRIFRIVVPSFIAFLIISGLTELYRFNRYDEELENLKGLTEDKFADLKFQEAFQGAIALNKFYEGTGGLRSPWWYDYTNEFDYLRHKTELAFRIFEDPYAFINHTQREKIIETLTWIAENPLEEPDPDVLALHAYLCWKLGNSKTHEYTAALLSANALKIASKTEEHFPLRALAVNYLNNFYYNFYDQQVEEVVNNKDSEWNKDKYKNYFKTLIKYSINELKGQELRNKYNLDYSPKGEFANFYDVNQTIFELYKQVSKSYIDMMYYHSLRIFAQNNSADLTPIERKEFTRNRNANANIIWQTFESFEAKTQSNILVGASFLSTNDAIYSRSQFFRFNSNYSKLVPRYFSPSMGVELREKCLPIRGQIVENFLNNLNEINRLHDLLKTKITMDQAEKFDAIDENLADFELLFYRAIRRLKLKSSKEDIENVLTELIETSYRINLLFIDKDGEVVCPPKYIYEYLTKEFKDVEIKPFAELDKNIDFSIKNSRNNYSI